MANPTARLSICRSCLNLLADPSARDDKKFEAAQQIHDELQFIIDNHLIDQAITTFLDYLEQTEPQFISEKPRQKLRKLVLQMIHRLQAIFDDGKKYLARIIKVLFHTFEIDNEENVAIAMRVIVELHKKYNPEFSPDIFVFLDKIKSIYSDIRNVYNLNTMFDERRIIVKDLDDQKIEELLKTIHTCTAIEIENPPQPAQGSSPQQSTSQAAQQQQPQSSSSSSQSTGIGTPGTIIEPSTPNPTIKASTSSGESTSATGGGGGGGASGSTSQPGVAGGATQVSKPNLTYTLIPRADRSMKILAELPLIVVLLQQQFREQLQARLEQLLPYILEITLLRPPESVRNAYQNSDKIDKEVYVEFKAAQIKCMSFVAYLVRIYIDTVTKNHQQLSRGLINLLQDCPHEVMAVRKELLASSRYIFQSELRDKFIDHLHILCNDDILVGSGWTTCEMLRPQGYALVIELLTNYRGRIKHLDIAAAVNLFSKNLHDYTLPPSVHLMACKAFTLLIGYTVAPLADENIEPREIAATRDLLMRMIEVFVLKFKNIAVFHLPNLKLKLKAAQQQQQLMIQQQQQQQQQQQLQQQQQQLAGQQSNIGQVPAHHIPQIPLLRPPPPPQAPIPNMARPGGQATGNPNESRCEDRTRVNFTGATKPQCYNIQECKLVIKTLISVSKSAVEAIPPYRLPIDQVQILAPARAKLFQPKETIVIERLLKHGLGALDIFLLASSAQPMLPMGQLNRQMMAGQASRGKEEKEIIEGFASVFTNLHPLMFQEIFTKMIDFLIERTRQNQNLLQIINYIISAPEVSPIFSTILSEYLIDRMEEIGSNDDLSDLHLRMFKMVFASVALYPIENEQMLKPLLHSIVNRSVELALGAKEPYNYFLLLRALFRSIGGGAHDQLYAEFLPLLPNLLQGLNSFQSGQHKKHMKDLFTELCLTVPVRLSSLMPFMPTLIYPLVSALNGPNQLVIQGMRTLELCVDNLSSDYLYDLLQPVRADLMQGLWRTLRHPRDDIAQSCLRLLGKFGGNNRRMLLEPQKLTCIEQKEGSSSHGTTVMVHFPDQKVSISLPINQAVHAACENLKQTMNIIPYYKLHSWELIKGFLIASICNAEGHSQKIKTFFSNPNLASAHIPIRRENIYKCQDEVARGVYQEALVGMMIAASIRELKNSVMPFLNAIVRHHVMLSIGQHLSHQSADQYQGMDPYSLVDALAIVLAHDDKDLCKSGYYVIILIVDTATMLLGSKERACELPLINYLVKTMYELCYTRAWFSKMGGCVSIRYFGDNMPLGWLFRYLARFVRALLYVMSDLTNELSSGVVDIAQTNLDRLLNVCGKPINPTNSDETTLAQAQTKALNDVTELLIKEITSQNLNVRTHAMKSIELMAKLAGKSAAQTMEPHRDILKSMLPFLAIQQDGDRQPQHGLEKQPVRTQIGIIHGSTFCTNLEPKVFTVDTSISEHKHYVDQLIKICENDDQTLKKLQCYANVTNLAPVRTAALQALASLHYLKDYENTIFKLLFKSTESTSPELQNEAYSCIVKFCSNIQIDLNVVQQEIAPMLVRLKESTMYDLPILRRMICIAKLFPAIFNEAYSLELFQHLTTISQTAVNYVRSPLNQNEKVYERVAAANEKIKICAAIMELMVLMPVTTPQTFGKMITLVFKIESAVCMETGSPMRVQLKAFLRKNPEQTIQVLIGERNLSEQQVYRFIKFILEGEDGAVFRNVINQQNAYSRLLLYTSGVVEMVSPNVTEKNENGQMVPVPGLKFDLRFQSILIISIMIKYDKDWLLARGKLVDSLRTLWMSEDFHKKHNGMEKIDYTHWEEPKLLVRCLLNYFQNQTEAGNKEVIELLFQLLRVFMNRYLCDFEFFRLFLEKTVIETYSIEWKRDAFAKFVHVFQDSTYPQKLKAKILQYIIIPSFAHSFEKGLGEALLGGPPQPERDNPNNLIHMFINKVIDPICSQDPGKKIIISDTVRILLLQFSCILVEQASPHIHEATNRRQSNRLKKFVTLAWPCLVARQSVDPAARYHGHYLLAHIIAKFAVHKRIIIQVFQGLLKASMPEARFVVKQALDILLPAIPNRLEDGNALLLKWTRKCIMEECQMPGAVLHMLQLIVRHYTLYYPIRTHLLPHMISALQKLSVTANSTIDNRRTAIDLCDVIIRWEMTRQKEVRDHQRAQELQQQQQQQQVAVSTAPAQAQPPAPPAPATATSASPVAPAPAAEVAKVGETSTTPAPASDKTIEPKVDTSAEPAQPTSKPSEEPQPSTTADVKPTIVDGKIVEKEGSEKSNDVEMVDVSTGGDKSTTSTASAVRADSPSTQKSTSTDNSNSNPPAPAETQQQQQQQQQQNTSSTSDTQNADEFNSDKKKPMGADDPLEPLDPKHVDAILNALLRLACVVNPGYLDGHNQPTQMHLSYKTLSERCINMIRKILMPETWGGSPITGPDGPNLVFSNWMSEMLCQIRLPNCPNIGCISGALEMLAFLCGTIKQETMLASLRIVTNGIIECSRSGNSRIIKAVSNLIQRVFQIFPAQPVTPSSTNAAPHIELENLYQQIYQVIMTGLNSYDQYNRNDLTQPPMPRERDTWQVPLFSSLMLLKGICINNPTYIDRLMPTLIRVISKMTKEHISQIVETTQMSIELLCLGLDLVKNRLGTMSVELRKQFIQQILSNLIESPSSDVKVLKAVVKIVEDWVKQKQVPPNQGPSLREKSLLLIKLMLYIEKRFPLDPELNSQFLELIYFVFRDDELKNTDLTPKLENAFMAGLRCVQPQIRSKFFNIYDQAVKPKLYERLMYIVCAQNWYSIGSHFWIQQCIEFILAIAYSELPISTTDSSGCLAPIPVSADLGPYNPSELGEQQPQTASHLLSMLSNDTTVPPPSSSLSSSSHHQPVEDIDFVAQYDQIDNLTGFLRTPKSLEEMSPRKSLQVMVNRQVQFLEDLKKTRTGDLLKSLTQLCHLNVGLAKTTWIDMFPRIWKVLNDQQMTLLGREIIPFLCSGAHAYQRDCEPSAVGAFMEAVSRCQPPIQMRPILIKYLGKNHNIWHRAALMLEESLKDKSLDTIYPIPARSNKSNQQNQKDFDIITLNSKVTLAEEAVESVSDILELLREDDLWCGLWQRKSRYDETKSAVLCEQQGLFAQAQEYYEAAMNRQRMEFDNTYILQPGMKSENRVWEKHWIRCTKELNQWDSLLEYGSSKSCLNPMLVMESAWRVPNWPMMKEALMLVEQNCPASMMWRFHIYKGYNAICNNEGILNNLTVADESFTLASSYCIQTWKKLPHIVTNAHIPLLQASQQILELNEAKGLHMALFGLVARNALTDVRQLLKGWPKRMPILLDDLSHWSDILTWRQHQFQVIVNHFEVQARNQAVNQVGMGGMCMNDAPASVAMHGSHFSAQGVISFGTVARKQGLLNVCLESINRIHTIPSVPIFDCYQKIRQQIKCYLQMPLSPDRSELLDGLDIIESTQLKYFQKEYISEFYTYKGIFLARLGRHDDSNKAFSAAAQMIETAPKVWSSWGDYMENRFTAEFTQSYEGFTINPSSFQNRQMDLGVSAVTCYLQACKFYSEPKARKYLARVLWLLSFDNQKGELVDLINRYSGPTRETGIPASNWVVWVPQILQNMMLNPETDTLRNLLIYIGKHSPQAVYFPVRTLLNTLRVVTSYSQTQKMRMSSGMPGTPMQRPSQTPTQQPMTPMTPMTSTHTPSGVTVMSQTPVTPASSSDQVVPMMVDSPQPMAAQQPQQQQQQQQQQPQPQLMPLVPPSPAAQVPFSPSPQVAMSPAAVVPSTPSGPSATPVTTQAPLTQPLTPRPAPSPGFNISSPYAQPQPSPSSSNTAASQPTLIQQLQQPPALLPHSQSMAMPSPGGPGAMMGGNYPQSPQAKQLKQRARTVVKCNEIIKRLNDTHPTTIASLEAISDQLVWFRDCSYEEVQRQVQVALTQCYACAFENATNNIAEQPVAPKIVVFIKTISARFGLSNNHHNSFGNNQRSGYHNRTVDYLNMRNQVIAQDPEFQQTRAKFRTDFDDSLLSSMKLIPLIAKLKTWIGILAQKKKLMPKTYLMEDRCKFLSNFSQHTADVEIPGDAQMPKSTIYYVRIARFIPEVRVVEKLGTSARRILIRGHNGKVYPYLVLNDTCLSYTRREERVLQMLRLLNQYLVNRKETGRRYLRFTVPRVVAIHPTIRLMEDNPSSLSLIDILRRRINNGQANNSNKSLPATPVASAGGNSGSLGGGGSGSGSNSNDLDQDSPITEYYDRLIKFQAQNMPMSQRHLRDILLDIQNKMVPKSLLKDWAAQTYTNATDYWVFRSQFTYQMAMACLSEYAFHFERLMPDMIYVHQDTGQVNVAFYKFDLDEATCEFRSNKQVPFRLTPNIAELMTPTGIVGPFRGALDAAATAFTQPQSRVISIFRAIFRDELLFWQRPGQDQQESLIVLVNKAIDKIYQRMQSISATDKPLESLTPKLITQATSADQLAQMDPAWHPWL